MAGEFVTFSGEGAVEHLKRVKRNNRNSIPHLLIVELVIVDTNGQIALKNPKPTANERSNKHLKALPTYKPDEITAWKKYVKPLRQHLGDMMLDGEDASRIASESMIDAVGIYKDVDTTVDDLRTRVTHLPARVVLPPDSSGESIEIQPIHRRMRGELTWHEPDKALRELNMTIDLTGYMPAIDAHQILTFMLERALLNEQGTLS